VRLEPKVMDVLCFLAEEPGRVRSKDEILEAVWQRPHVTESVLTRAVAELRKALGDEAAAPEYIETVPRRGYRLLAPVRPASGDDPAAPGGASSRWLRLSALAPLVLAAVALVAGATFLLRGEAADSGASRDARSGQPIGPVPRARHTQLTATPETEAFPELAPDGRSLVYASDASGHFELYLLQTGSRTGADRGSSLDAASRPVRLTDDGADNVQPAFSPDGRWIAYHSVGRGGVWLIPALGGEPRQVSSFGSDPVWTPDGERIVFQSGELTVVSLDTFPAFPPSTLWEVDVEAGEPRRLTEDGRPPGGHGAPTVSPDGRWIAFSAFDVGVWTLWVMPAAGGGGPDEGPRRIGGLVRPADPVFSPDGRALYAADVVSSYRLARIPFDPQTGTATGPPETLSGITGRHLAVSPDGSALAVSRLVMTSDLWGVPVDPASGRAVGPETPLTRDTSVRTSAPSFSPDGSRLSYGTKRAGLDPEIWVMESDGRGARQLVGPTPGAFHSYWLTDGRIAFGAFVRGGRELRAIDPDTRRVERLGLVPFGWSAPVVERRGRRIAFHRSDGRGGSDVWVQRLDRPDRSGSAEREPPRRVTAERAPVSFPAFSPDGRWLAVEVQYPASSQLAVVPVEGGELRFLTSGPGHRWSYAWSPDGRWVLFSGLRDGRWNLYRVPFAEAPGVVGAVGEATGGPEPVTTHDASLTSFVRYPDWSPRGDLVAYERRQTTGDLWLVTFDE
jgi:Tol biopolymer transport system component